MFQSIIIYSIAILIFFFLAKGCAKEYWLARVRGELIESKKYTFFSSKTITIILLFAVFCGLRYDVGADYLEYYRFYVYFDYWEEYIFQRYEPGFLLMMETCKKFKLPVTFFFGGIALIQMALFLLAFRKERYLWSWLMLFFFINGGFMLWMNGLRQCIALCIWMCSIYFIEERKPYLYVIFCLLAMSFHSSAIILVFLYPLLRSGTPYFKNILFQYTIIAISLVIGTALESVFIFFAEYYVAATGSYAQYIESLGTFSSYSNTNIVYWYKLLIYGIIIYYSNSLRSFFDSKRFNIVYTLFFIGVVAKYLIPPSLSIFLRIFLYFTFFDSVVFAYFVYYLGKQTDSDSQIIKAFMIISFIGVFFGNQIVSSEKSSVWYQFIFDQPMYDSIF